MEARTREISAKADKGIKMGMIPGHFATNHSHINYYVDITGIKTHYKMARKAAAELASAYGMTTIDTIICLEGTEMIGAYMADVLAQPGPMTMNNGIDICVLTPELNSNNQMIFRDNTQRMVWGKNVLMLLSSVSTGKTVNRAMECLRYYSGRLTGICALFSAVREMHGVRINSVFTEADLPDYKTFAPADCKMCAEGLKIDAIVNSFGYSKL